MVLSVHSRRYFFNLILLGFPWGNVPILDLFRFFPKGLFIWKRQRQRELGGGAEEVGERVSRQLCAEHAAQCRARSHDHVDPDHNLSWNRVRSSINCTTQMPLFNFLKSCPIRRIWRKRQKCQITTFLQFYYCYSRSALALE